MLDDCRISRLLQVTCRHPLALVVGPHSLPLHAFPGLFYTQVSQYSIDNFTTNESEFFPRKVQKGVRSIVFLLTSCLRDGGLTNHSREQCFWGNCIFISVQSLGGNLDLLQARRQYLISLSFLLGDYSTQYLKTNQFDFYLMIACGLTELCRCWALTFVWRRIALSFFYLLKGISFCQFSWDKSVFLHTQRREEIGTKIVSRNKCEAEKHKIITISSRRTCVCMR